MPHHITHDLSDAGALVVARTLIMNIPEGALNRIRLRAVRGQADHLEARMPGQPSGYGFRRMNAIVVTHDIEARTLA